MTKSLIVAALVCGASCFAYVWSFAGVAPVWDGFHYAESIVAMPDRIASGAGVGQIVRALAFWDHPTLAYGVMQLPGQLLERGFASIVFTNAILAMVAVWFFLAAVRRCVPEAGVLALVAAGFALAANPVFLSSALHVNVDFAVAVALCVGLYAYVANRAWLVGVAGLLLLFSKEPGTLLYGSLLGSVFLVTLVRWIRPELGGESPTFGGQARLQDVPGRLWLLLPFVALGAFLLHNHASDVPVVWGHEVETDDSLGTQLLGGFSASVGTIATRMIQVFVLSYEWVGTLLVMGVLVWRRGRLAPRIAWSDQLVFVAVFLGFAGPSFLYDTFVNARYVLPAIVLLSFAIVVMALAVIPHRRLGTSVLVVFALLQGSQLSRTSDPVSRALLGTFEFGDHEMLDMTSFTGECCGSYGRDQLVYNTQFTAIPRLIDRAYERLPVGDDTAVIAPPHSKARLFQPPRDPTLRLGPFRGVPRAPEVLTTPSEVVALLEGRAGARVYLIETPWYGAVEKQRRKIGVWFDLRDVGEVDDAGYRLRIFELRLHSVGRALESQRRAVQWAGTERRTLVRPVL